MTHRQIHTCPFLSILPQIHMTHAYYPCYHTYYPYYHTCTARDTSPNSYVSFPVSHVHTIHITAHAHAYYPYYHTYYPYYHTYAKFIRVLSCQSCAYYPYYHTYTSTQWGYQYRVPHVTHGQINKKKITRVFTTTSYPYYVDVHVW